MCFCAKKLSREHLYVLLKLLLLDRFLYFRFGSTGSEHFLHIGHCTIVKENVGSANKPKESKKKKKHESSDAITKAKPQNAPNVGHMQTSEEPERFPKFSPYRPEKRSSYKIIEDENSDVVSAVTRNNDRLEAVGIRSSNHRKTEITKSTSVIQKYSINTSASEGAEYNFSTSTLNKCIVIFLCIASAVSYRIIVSDKIDKQQVDIKPIKEKFPQQDPEFWKSIISGLNLTIQFQQPTSYIFLYESEAEWTMKKLLVEVSKYAVFQLTESTNSPINFTKEIIENHQFANALDYGSVLSQLKGKLETNGLMIIENIEKVPEKYALAFHSFCDEVTPVVKKSAFFFTMKVDKLEQSPLFDIKNVQKILREHWPNIEEDYFEPLVTRFSGMILRVYPNLEDS